MKRYLVTGAAGFIANKVAELLLAQGHTVTGLDNLNDAYDVRLKDWRLNRLRGRPGFSFRQMDICDSSILENVWSEDGPFDAVILLKRMSRKNSLPSPRGKLGRG
jgi:nucleoside-diphosphate-sugar epimerase